MRQSKWNHTYKSLIHKLTLTVYTTRKLLFLVGRKEILENITSISR